MNYKEYMANIKAYRNGTLMQAAPTDALSDWHEKYFDTAVSALSKKMIADHVEHSEDADKFGKDFVSLVAILEEDGVSKQDIGKELEAVSHAAQSKADAAIKKLDSVQHSTDTLEGYQAAIRAYKEAHLEHGEWKKHKYIRIENGRYIYPDDLKKTGETNQNVANIASQINRVAKAAGSKERINGVVDSNGNILTDKYGKKFVDDLNKEANASKKAAVYTRSEMDARNAKKAAADAMKAGRTATQQYKESGQYEKDVADEKAKRETMARQDEAKKITSMTPEEARKRAAELTKQNTPEKKVEAPTKESVKKEMVDYFKANGGTFKEGDNALTFKDKLESVGFNQKDLSDMLSEAKQSTTQAPKQEESDKYTPIKPENMTKEQLDAFKEMSREYMEGMEYSAKQYQQQNQRPTKVVVTKTDPYTGAPTAAKVTYIDNNGHEQDTGYFFKDLSEDATPDNLQRRIDSKKKVQHSDPRAAFYAAVDEYKEKHLEHGEWKKHKYIRIENGRYIYPEDAKKGSIGAKVSGSAKNPVNGDLKSGNYVKFENGKAVYSNTSRPGYQLTSKAAAGMKKFAESTSQLSPQEQYKKAQAEKNAGTSSKPEAPKAETPSNEDRVKAMMDAHHEELKKAVYDNYKKNAQEIIKGNGKYFSDLVTDPSKAEEYNTKRNGYVQACSNDMLSNYLFAKGTGLSNEEAKEYVVSILDDLNNSYKEGLKSKGYEADSEKSPFSVVFQETDHGTDKASVASLSISFDGRVKKIQHSLFSRDYFYAAVADYKNQRVPL